MTGCCRARDFPSVDGLLLLTRGLFCDFSIGVDVRRGDWSGVLFDGERRKELKELRRFISDFELGDGVIVAGDLTDSDFFVDFRRRLSVLNWDLIFLKNFCFVGGFSESFLSLLLRLVMLMSAELVTLAMLLSLTPLSDVMLLNDT